MTMYTFKVFDVPQPQGSTRAFVSKGRAITTSANPKNRPWRALVRDAAREAYPDDSENPALWFPEGPLAVTLVFWLPRAPSIPKKRTDPVVKPDLDKLVRSVLDALTGLAWKDDSQVCQLSTAKNYAGTARQPQTGIMVTERLAIAAITTFYALWPEAPVRAGS